MVSNKDEIILGLSQANNCNVLSFNTPISDCWNPYNYELHSNAVAIDLIDATINLSYIYSALSSSIFPSFLIILTFKFK